MKHLKPKLISYVLMISLLLSAGIYRSADVKAAAGKGSYGVFVGLDRTHIKKLYSYDTVVIDASEYSKKDIAKLHKKNVKVYSYLNIGSIETYRSYYKKFDNLTLGSYENWPDERWMDVSRKKWQDYVILTLARGLNNKKIDGFFIDNADIYENYKTDKIYAGVKKILTGIKKRYKKDVILNGGSVFVEQAISKKEKLARMFDGVNQENVFTTINFKTGTFKTQSRSETGYYQKYLNQCNKKHLDIYLTEYANPKASVRKQISKYCRKKHYNYYISPNLGLT